MLFLFFMVTEDFSIRERSARLLAIGVCVIGFSFYSILILKEKFASLSLAGLAAVCLGIIVISLK